jgi:phosphate-selective porin
MSEKSWKKVGRTMSGSAVQHAAHRALGGWRAQHACGAGPMDRFGRAHPPEKKTAESTATRRATTMTEYRFDGPDRDCNWGDQEFRRQWQRHYRASMKASGYRRMEITLSAKVWERLEQELDPQSARTHPGSAVADWIAWMVQPE